MQSIADLASVNRTDGIGGEIDSVAIAFECRCLFDEDSGPMFDFLTVDNGEGMYGLIGKFEQKSNIGVERVDGFRDFDPASAVWPGFL